MFISSFRLRKVLALTVTAVVMSVALMNDVHADGNGCVTTKCHYNDFFPEGDCGFRTAGGHDYCACFATDGNVHVYVDTCECSTHQYPPCGGTEEY